MSSSSRLYGFPTIMACGLSSEFKNVLNPPFLIVTMRLTTA